MEGKYKKIWSYLALTLSIINFFSYLFVNAIATVFITASVAGIYVYSKDLLEEEDYDRK